MTAASFSKEQVILGPAALGTVPAPAALCRPTMAKFIFTILMLIILPLLSNRPPPSTPALPLTPPPFAIPFVSAPSSEYPTAAQIPAPVQIGKPEMLVIKAHLQVV